MDPWIHCYGLGIQQQVPSRLSFKWLVYGKINSKTTVSQFEVGCFIATVNSLQAFKCQSYTYKGSGGIKKKKIYLLLNSGALKF